MEQTIPQSETTEQIDMSASWQELYKQGKELTTLGEYQTAKKMFEQAINLSQEDNEQLYVQFGHLLMLMKETELAKQILSKAITLHTKAGEYNKYFELAQLSYGQEALQLYQEGIKIILQEIVKIEEVNILEQNEDILRLKRDICDAYGAIAELYMSDLENEANGQENCLYFIEKGLSIDQKSVDCNLQLGNYYLRIGKDELAYNAMEIVVEEIVKSENENNLGCEQGIEFLIKVAQVVCEMKQFEWAVRVLKIVVDKDVHDIEGLYLMAFAQLQIGNVENAAEFLEVLEKEDLSADEEIQLAAKELKEALVKKQEDAMGEEDNGNTNNNTNNNDDNDDDNEWMDIE